MFYPRIKNWATRAVLVLFFLLLITILTQFCVETWYFLVPDSSYRVDVVNVGTTSVEHAILTARGTPTDLGPVPPGTTRTVTYKTLEGTSLTFRTSSWRFVTTIEPYYMQRTGRHVQISISGSGQPSVTYIR